jgi:TRAP-type C4-dicarboxylate transport system permease small subunit
MTLFVRMVHGLSLLCGVVAAGLIAAAVVVVCQMVFIRYVLNDNTIWQTDFVTFSLVGATFIGAPFVLMTKGHVNVDVVPLALGARGRFWLAVIATTLSMAFALVMTVLTIQFWQEAWDNDWQSESIWRVRLWIPYAAMPIGLGILTLQYVADFLELMTGRVRPYAGEVPEQVDA